MSLAMVPLLVEFPEIDPFVFQIGGFGLRWYALAYLAGLLIGWRYVVMLTKRESLWPANKPPFAPDHAEGLLFLIVFGVIIGGRLGYVFFYNASYFLQNPLDILKTWEGGMAFHGGFLGVVVAALLFCRAMKAPLLSTGDALAAATPIGLLFGRMANFINGELWGKPWPNGQWAMIFPYDPTGLPRHPSQLYEAATEGFLLLIILAVMAFSGGLKRPGLLMGVFLAGYGLARASIEYFREPNEGLGCVIAPGGHCLQMGQVLSLPMILVGLLLIIWALRPKNG